MIQFLIKLNLVLSTCVVPQAIMHPNVKLPPIRMSDLKSADPPVKTPVSKLYTPPNKRTPLPSLDVKDIDLSDKAFPSLSQVPAQLSPVKVGGFKQKILDLIAKDLLDEAERNKEPQADPLKMTNQELVDAGWAILPVRNRRNGVVYNKLDEE